MRVVNCFTALMLVFGYSALCEASENWKSGREEAAVVEAVQGYVDGFLNNDVEGLMALWDTREPESAIYVAVEVPTPFFGVASLRPYYEQLVANYQVLSGDISNLQIRREGDQAYVFCFIDWTYRVRATGQLQSFRDRATFVMQKRGQHWFYRHLHESTTVMP